MTAQALAGMQILLVEDDGFIRSTLRRILNQFGATGIQEAVDGSAALRVLRDGFRADLILCDVQMTPMDGITFLKRLRAAPDPGCAYTPVIIFTGAADLATVTAVSGQRNCGYLLKPVVPKLLIARIDAVLQAQTIPE